MDCWTDFLLDAQKIKAIFTDALPTLIAVNLHEIVLHRDGPRALLRFDVASYPLVPPKKWQQQGFNRVQIQLMLIGVREVSIKGWKEQCQIDLLLYTEAEKIKLTSENGPVKIEIIADFVNIGTVSGYRDNLLI